MHKKQSFCQIYLPIFLALVTIGVIAYFLIGGAFSGRFALTAMGDISAIYLIFLLLFPGLVVFLVLGALVVLIAQAPDGISTLFAKLSAVHGRANKILQTSARSIITPITKLGSLGALLKVRDMFRGMDNDGEK